MNLLQVFSEYYGLLKTSVKYQTKEFFDNSTLHGIRYIAEEGRAFFEKFIWFCLVSVGAVAAFVIIGTLWEKFQTNPTITGKQCEETRTIQEVKVHVTIFTAPHGWSRSRKNFPFANIPCCWRLRVAETQSQALSLYLVSESQSWSWVNHRNWKFSPLFSFSLN